METLSGGQLDMFKATTTLTGTHLYILVSELGDILESGYMMLILVLMIHCPVHRPYIFLVQLHKLMSSTVARVAMLSLTTTTINKMSL